jgi:hypothetical protein
VFTGYRLWHSSSMCLQYIPIGTFHVFAVYPHWHSTSMCLQDIPIGTVHPCAYRISPLAQFIHVFTGYHLWHSSSMCLQDITSEWHSSSLCLLDMTVGTVHPCVCRISPLAHTEPDDASPRPGVRAFSVNRTPYLGRL